MFGSHRADELSWLAGVAWNHGYESEITNIYISLLSSIYTTKIDLVFRLETAKSNQNELAHQLFREAADFASHQGDTGINTQAVRRNEQKKKKIIIQTTQERRYIKYIS